MTSMIGKLVRLAAFQCLAIGALHSRASGQPTDRVEVRVYHGAPSRVFRFVDSEGRTTLRDGTSLHLNLPTGGSVCYVVPNANPAVFTYAVNVGLDTTGAQLDSQAAKLASLLAQLVENTGADAASGYRPPAVQTFLKTLETISTESESLITLSQSAAAPGALDEGKAIVADHGYALIKRGIQAISKDDGHVRSEKAGEFVERQLATTLAAIASDRVAKARDFDVVSETLQSLTDRITSLEAELSKLKDKEKKQAKELEIAAAKVSKESAIATKAVTEAQLGALAIWAEALPVMANHAKLELASARKILDSYTSTSGEYRNCSSVRDGRNTLTLKFGTKDNFKTDLRASDSVSVVVDALFKRPRLEIYPAAFVVRHGDVPTYEIRNDSLLLGGQDTKLDPRLGAMATITLFDRFDELRSVALSAGLGTNIVGGEDPITDLMAQMTVSYRDLFRVGVGGGFVPVKELKTGLTVGAPVPPGTKSSDLFVTKHRWDLVILFSLSSLKIGLFK
jgi:hypothetical protein